MRLMNSYDLSPIYAHAVILAFCSVQVLAFCLGHRTAYAKMLGPHIADVTPLKGEHVALNTKC